MVVADHKVSTHLEGAGDLEDVSYSHDRTRLLTVGAEGQKSPNLVCVWEKCEDSEWRASASWQVENTPVKGAWAHPEFGQIVAFSGKFGVVEIWEESEPKIWVSRATLKAGAPVRDITFAPQQQGLLLAAASADGAVRLYKPASVFPAIGWELENSFQATSTAECLSLAWRQHTAELPPCLLVGVGEQEKKEEEESQESIPETATAAIWQYNAKLARWWQCREFSMEEANGNARAVSWAPQLGRPVEQVAIASDMVVHIFSFHSIVQNFSAQALQHRVLRHVSKVWKVDWNMLGNVLAAAAEDRSVQLWRANFAAEWTVVGRIQGEEDPDEDQDMDEYLLVNGGL